MTTLNVRSVTIVVPAVTPRKEAELAKNDDKPQTQEHYRDAKTGRYVTEKYADKHPNTTVKETDKTGKK